MEIRIYNPNMDFKGLIENQSSLIWTRRYNESGEFELHAPVTSDNINLLKLGNLIWKRGAVDAGVIESIYIEETVLKNEITAKGRFLTSYMDRRLIRPTFNFSGKVEIAMRTILTNAVAIPRVQLGELQGFDEEIEFQATYKNLLTYESKLAKSANLGFRFKPNFDDKIIVFEIYKGLDRSIHQNDRNRVIFSESYNNLSEADYEENEQIYSNVCYVGGQGEGSQRTYVVVGDTTATGLELREMYKNGADISSENLTTAQYLDKLRQRGYDALEENAFYNYFECKTVPEGNFNYGTNYDLGDIITVEKVNWGITQDLRLSAIQEIYEYGNQVIEPVFGNPLPETVDWEDKDNG